MKEAGQEVPSKPTVPELRVRKLRAKLILEEAFETVKALGFEIVDSSSYDQYANDPHVLESGNDNHTVHIILMEGKNGSDRIHLIPDTDRLDMEQVADGCADLSVVTIGTLSAFGIADEGLLQMVDATNLAKFGPGGHKRDDGKWIKPPDWKPPEITKLLADQSR